MMTQRRRTRRRRRAAAVLSAVAAGAVLAACGGGKAASTTTSTLPPLPPSVIALVSLAGTGSGIGTGKTVVPVTLTGNTGGSQVGLAIPVGDYPDAIAVTPNGETAYVANYTSNTVTPIDLATDTSGKPIPVGVGPAGIAIAPNGKTAYVTDDGSASSLGDTVTPIDLVTGKPEAAITVGSGPQGIAITPDGSTAYVADAGAIVAGQTGGIGRTVTPIDLATRKALAPITVGNGPTGIAVSPDGSTVVVTNLDSESVSTISTASKRAAAPVPVEGGPIAVAVADGAAWVVDGPSNSYGGDNVTPISLSTGRAGTPIGVGKGAQDIAVAPGGKTAWVSCLQAQTLVPVKLLARRAGTAVRVLGGPFALAITTKSSGTSHPHRHKKKRS